MFRNLGKHLSELFPVTAWIKLKQKGEGEVELIWKEWGIIGGGALSRFWGIKIQGGWGKIKRVAAGKL